MLEKTMKKINEIEKGECHLDNGNAKLFTPIKELRTDNCDFDKNYLYEMYPPLSDYKIDQYVQYYKHSFPEELKHLYRYTNGIRLFDRYISVAGIEPPNTPWPNHGGRSYTPIQLVDTWGNAPRDQKHYGDGRLFFAWYDTYHQPQKFVYMDCTDSSLKKPVHLCYKGSEEVIESWESFDEWFSCEYEKYLQKYNNKDYQVVSFGNEIVKKIYFD